MLILLRRHNRRLTKFVVIDNKTVITGSLNLSPSAAHTNDETLLVIHSPQLAKHFAGEMDRLWDTAELGITPHIQRKARWPKNPMWSRCGEGLSSPRGGENDSDKDFRDDGFIAILKRTADLNSSNLEFI